MCAAHKKLLSLAAPQVLSAVQILKDKIDKTCLSGLLVTALVRLLTQEQAALHDVARGCSLVRTLI